MLGIDLLILRMADPLISRQALLYSKNSARRRVRIRKDKSDNTHNSGDLDFYERQLGVKDLVLFSSDQDIENNSDCKNQVT